ncbi:MAG: hypothetical protein V3R76_00340 [Gammaproteobacteria bacterium]
MGMLDGFVAGAADEYTKQRDEDRVEEKVIKSEIRADKFDEIRQNRMAEINKTTAKQLAITNKATAAEGFHQKRHTATNVAEVNQNTAEKLAETNATAAELKVTNDATADEIKAKAKLTETQIVSPSSSARVWDPIKETWSFDQAPPKPSTTGKDGKFTEKDATTFFKQISIVYFGGLDESGIYSFGTDDNSHMAAAAGSVSNRLWLKRGGTTDANTIWAIVYRNIKAGKAKTVEDIAAIGLELEQLSDDKWWFQADSPETAQLVEDQKKLLEEGKKKQMDLPGQKPGMLEESEGGSEEPVYIDGAKYPEGTKLVDKEGVDWIVKNGKPVRVQ